MKWSYRIARIAGIDIRIHLTFLLLPLFFGITDWQSGGAAAAAESVAFILVLFFCVLLHELGHALAGRAFGIRTPDITLLPIGGVARMERIPAYPLQELVIAVAGPAVNVVIAGAIYSWLALAGAVGTSGLNGFLNGLALVNVGLVVFNCIPAFPMDGGRVLRALLAMRLRYLTATKIAVRIGQAIALLFAAAGFFWNPMLVLVAVFVFGGAQQELEYAKAVDEFSRRFDEAVQRAGFGLERPERGP
jgi:stage IV sporulation protein FB